MGEIGKVRRNGHQRLPAGAERIRNGYDRRKFMEDVMENIHEIKERYSDAAKEAGEAAQKRLSQAAAKTKEKSQELWSATSELIAEYPGAAIGLAFLGGLVVSGLLTYERRPRSIRQHLGRMAEDLKPTLNNARESTADALSDLREMLDEAISKIK